MTTPPRVECKDCHRPLKSRLARKRRRGARCYAKHLATLPGRIWLAWHASPPRWGHLPAGDVDGQEALFCAQPELPGVRPGTGTPTREEAAGE